MFSLGQIPRVLPYLSIQCLHLLEHFGLDRCHVKKHLIDTFTDFFLEGVVPVHLLDFGLSLVFVELATQLPLLILKLDHRARVAIDKLGKRNFKVVHAHQIVRLLATLVVYVVGHWGRRADLRS